MENREFEQGLRERFADPPVPQSLQPQEVRRRLEKVRPVIRPVPLRVLSAAAGILLVAGLAVFAAGALQPVPKEEPAAISRMAPGEDQRAPDEADAAPLNEGQQPVMLQTEVSESGEETAPPDLEQEKAGNVQSGGVDAPAESGPEEDAQDKRQEDTEPQEEPA